MVNHRSSQEHLKEIILGNVETIISVQDQRRKNLPTHQRILESIARAFGQTWFLYAELLFFASWALASHLIDIQRISLDMPHFSFQDQGLDVASLIISTGVLIYETRQEEFSEEREHLVLQLNLINEQKIAKIIALLEELRADLPNVPNRLDLEAEAMEETTDPQVILDIIQENLEKDNIETETS